MTDKWQEKVEQATEKWSAKVDEISIEQWRHAMTAQAGRAGAWRRMTRRQRAAARIRGRIRRVARAARRAARAIIRL